MRKNILWSAICKSKCGQQYQEEVLNFVIDWREQMIRLAEIADLETILQITHDTISEIYCHHYAEGVVGFFLGHHSREHILSDIENEIVWLLEEGGNAVGTVTIKGNAVNRLFVLPEWQSHGYGSQLMDLSLIHI